MSLLQPGTARRPGAAEAPPGRPGVVATGLLALAIVALAAGAALGASRLLETRYGARTELVFDLGAQTPEPEADRLLATQLVVLGSRAVVAPVAERHGVAPEALAEAMEVERLEGSEVIRITVGDTDAARALAIAGQVASAYRERATRPPPGVSERVEAVEGRLGELVRGRARLAAELASAPAPDDRRRLELEGELAVVEQRIADALEGLAALEREAAPSATVRSLTAPYLLAEPLSPRPVRAVAAGTLAGLLLASATVLALYRRGWAHR